VGWSRKCAQQSLYLIFRLARGSAQCFDPIVPRGKLNRELLARARSIGAQCHRCKRVRPEQQFLERFSIEPPDARVEIYAEKFARRVIAEPRFQKARRAIGAPAGRPRLEWAGRPRLDWAGRPRFEWAGRPRFK